MKNIQKLDIDGLIDRIKLFLNIKSDVQLSTYLKKSPNFIAVSRTRGSIDLETVVLSCPDADLNWLLLGHDCEKKTIARLDLKGNRIEIPIKIEVSPGYGERDVNTSESEVDEIIKQLKEKDFILFETMKQLHEAQKIIAEYQLRGKRE